MLARVTTVFDAETRMLSAAPAKSRAPSASALAIRLMCTALLTGMLAANLAFAHTVGKGLATITLSGSSVQYSLLLAVNATAPQAPDAVDLGPAGATPDYGRLLTLVTQQVRIEADGKACAPGTGSVTPPAQPGGTVSLRLPFECPSLPHELVVRDRLFDKLGRDYVTIANIQWQGGSQQFVFQPAASEARVTVVEGASTRGAGSFFLLGIEHILTGYDHLLFLLMLILRGGNLWSLLKIITAFTVAHSITLALAALNIVVLPERLVESVIALSIAYVAAENLFFKKAVSHRWAVSFLFGLMHGFGFSNVLRELGLPKAGLLWSLLSFNLGVEAGQAFAVLLAVPVLLWLRKTRFEPRSVATLSAIVLVVGLVLFGERLLI
jgi:hypothetical protein